MDDFMIQIWAHGVCRKLTQTAIIRVQAFVLGRVQPWLANRRLLDDGPHIPTMAKGQPAPA